MMQRSIESGGKTHIRYGHFRYPRVIEVECPFCAHLSWLSHKTASPDIESFLDIDYQELVWDFSCNKCLNRGQYTWEETQKLKLYFTVEAGNEMVWGWNRHHFQFLISVFSKTNKPDDPWSRFVPYIHKRWFIKFKKPSYIKKLTDRIQEAPF